MTGSSKGPAPEDPQSANVSRHHDALWKRIRDLLPWVSERWVSTHWLRHTHHQRGYGYGIARVCAGHTDTTGAPTVTFIRARLAAVAEALSALTGEPHPLLASEGSYHGQVRQEARPAGAAAAAEPAGPFGSGDSAEAAVSSGRPDCTAHALASVSKPTIIAPSPVARGKVRRLCCLSEGVQAVLSPSDQES